MRNNTQGSPMDPSRSPFAKALTRLLDDTARFSRAEWARFLGVSASAISQWVNDKTIPRADLLRIVLDVLRTSDGVPPEPLESFDRLALRPAPEISPLGARMMPTVTAYLHRSTFELLGRELRDLSPEQQVTVLEQGNWDVLPGIRSSSPARRELPPKLIAAPALADPAACSEPAVLPFLCDVDGLPHQARLQWQAALAFHAVLLIGPAGCGKTSMLSALASQAGVTGRALLIKAREHWGEGDPASKTEPWELSVRPPDVVLVDGFDEIPPESRPAAAHALEHYRSTAARVFIASRPVPELSFLRRFKALSVEPLTGVQMILWLRQAREQAPPYRRFGDMEMERFVCHMTERRPLQKSLKNPLLLERAWGLFSRNAVTCFAEAEVLGELARCLLDEPDVVRAREPWASPHTLWTLLGEISLQLIVAQVDEFAVSDAERWLSARFQDIPVHRLLPLLELQSGILAEKSPGRWTCSHAYFGRYFAASHLVESTDDPWQYLHGWSTRDDIREVLRLACGITSDATALLRGVLDAPDAPEPERCSLLAESLAQPLTAAHDVLAESCDTMVGWLDRSLEGWRLEPTPERWHGMPPDCLWGIQATGEARRDLDTKVPDTLAAIHRARSGPAKKLLVDRLGKATSPVLPAFATSMQFEGRLHSHYDVNARQGMLRAAVLAPELT